MKNLKDMIMETPDAEAAGRKADEVVKQAQVNEAVRIIDGLLEEVAVMKIAKRFNPERIPSQSPYAGSGAPMAPMFKGLSEPEYKREQLRLNLVQLKSEILTDIEKLRGIVMDVQAAKTEDVEETLKPSAN